MKLTKAMTLGLVLLGAFASLDRASAGVPLMQRESEECVIDPKDEFCQCECICKNRTGYHSRHNQKSSKVVGGNKKSAEAVSAYRSSNAFGSGKRNGLMCNDLPLEGGEVIPPNPEEETKVCDDKCISKEGQKSDSCKCECEC